MKLNKRLSSYPILISGDDDYVDSYFDVTLAQNTEFGKLKVSIEFNLNNSKLQDLIKEKKAGYVVHFECPLLCYRQLLSTDKNNIEYDIDLDTVDGSIDISTFIVALQDIPNYYNEKFNWEYGNEGIDITKGNVMSIGPTYDIKVDRDNNSFQKLSDVIRIKQYNNDTSDEISVMVESDVILILVSKNIKNQYYVQGKQYLYNIISMIMVPAMSYVLIKMKNDSEDLHDYRWYGVIERLLNQNNIEITQLRDDESRGKYSIYELSQKIFKSPLEKGINELAREIKG